MPFVPRATLEQLQAQNQVLSDELSQFEEMQPHLELAYQIREQIISVMDQHQDLSTAEIGEVAYRMVLDQQVGQARDEIAERYQQAHRRTLYDRLLQEVDQTEGHDINEAMRVRVETDPELALQLRNSAREELAARALDVVRGEVTAEQQQVINQEAERQIDLDRLDVRLASTGELDLTDPSVEKILEPGDRVDLFFTDHKGTSRRITLEWVQDANDDQGWKLTSLPVSLVDRDGYQVEINQSKFVTLGTLNADMTNGKAVFEPDTLRIGAPIAFEQTNKSGKLRLLQPRNATGYNGTSARLDGSDFQTKVLKFYIS